MGCSEAEIRAGPGSLTIHQAHCEHQPRQVRKPQHLPRRAFRTTCAAAPRNPADLQEVGPSFLALCYFTKGETSGPGGEKRARCPQQGAMRAREARSQTYVCRGVSVVTSPHLDDRRPEPATSEQRTETPPPSFLPVTTCGP